MRSYVERGGVWECGKVNWRVEAVRSVVAVQLQFGDVREQTNEEEVKNSTVPVSSLCCVWLRLGFPLGDLPDSMHTAELVVSESRL